MSPQVVKTATMLDSELQHYSQSCKSFFRYPGIGRWEGACFICNANAGATRIQEQLALHAARMAITARDQTADFMGAMDAMEAMDTVCPVLCERLAKQGAVNAIAECAITQKLDKCWDMQFDPAWPPQPTAAEEGQCLGRLVGGAKAAKAAKARRRVAKAAALKRGARQKKQKEATPRRACSLQGQKKAAPKRGGAADAEGGGAQAEADNRRQQALKGANRPCRAPAGPDWSGAQGRSKAG
jgi:hypothetical protein